MVEIDSSLAESINPQVFTIKISASWGLSVIDILLSAKIPSIISVSTRFLAHPKLTNPALSITKPPIIFPNGLEPIYLAIAAAAPGNTYHDDPAALGFLWHIPDIVGSLDW